VLDPTRAQGRLTAARLGDVMLGAWLLSRRQGRHGTARQGEAGVVRPGAVRLGKARRGPASRERVIAARKRRDEGRVQRCPDGLLPHRWV
jgi:hypothetical protein